MYLDRIAATESDALLIARDGLSAGQWELHLLEQGLLVDGAAAGGRRVTTFSAWLAASWDSLRAAGQASAERCLLSPEQTRRLWQRVIAESADGESLLGLAGLATGARAARASLFWLGLEPGGQETAGWRGDGAAFRRWNLAFERELATRGWIDPDSLLFELNRNGGFPLAGEHPALLDPAPPTPEIMRLLEHCAAAGRTLPVLRPNLPGVTPEARIARDPAAEIAEAAAFAARLLAASPGSRVALVVPDLEARREEVLRRLRHAIGDTPLSTESGQSTAAAGIVGAALGAIELLAGSGGFGALSRFLRSAFFALDEASYRDRAALLERALRADPRGAEDFATSYRRFGLRAELLKAVPELVPRLDDVLSRCPRRATPTAWSMYWQASLRTLGWQGFTVDLPERLHAAWEQIWSSFAGLTPILGPLTPAEARDEIVRIARSQRVYEAPGATGVHVLTALDRVGPGYAGVWVTGFDDQSWPASPEPNPLVPRAFRAARGMPGGDPASDLETASAAMAALLARVPAAVFSCPARILDQPRVPNPCFANWREAPRDLADRQPPAVADSARELPARVREELKDPAPPLAGERIPGGPRTLDLQAACPVLAFCTARLGAEPLETATRGLDARLRGILLHRAVELLLATGQPVEAQIGPSVDAAARELLTAGGAAWQRQVRAETARMQRILAAFVAAESTRGDFETLGVEQRVEIRLAGRRLRCRIDRIDRLPDGGLLIIDYKTGRRLPTGWLAEPLGDTQLPLYAQEFAATVQGIAAVRLGDDAIEYRGLGRLEGALPGRPVVLDVAAWQRQLADWHDGLVALIEAFAAGDVRVPAGDMTPAAGAYAAVTRVLEHSR